VGHIDQLGCGCRWGDEAVDHQRDVPLALGITLPEVLLEIPGEALRELRGQAGRGDQADRNPRLRRARALKLRRRGVDLDIPVRLLLRLEVLDPKLWAGGRSMSVRILTSSSGSTCTSSPGSRPRQPGSSFHLLAGEDHRTTPGRRARTHPDRPVPSA
jgi:hypothetical protein